jgi:hypothetical protein
MAFVASQDMVLSRTRLSAGTILQRVGERRHVEWNLFRPQQIDEWALAFPDDGVNLVSVVSAQLSELLDHPYAALRAGKDVTDATWPRVLDVNLRQRGWPTEGSGWMFRQASGRHQRAEPVARLSGDDM